MHFRKMNCGKGLLGAADQLRAGLDRHIFWPAPVNPDCGRELCLQFGSVSKAAEKEMKEEEEDTCFFLMCPVSFFRTTPCSQDSEEEET